MAKVKINSLPDGFELVDGKVRQKKSHGGGITGDQSDYGLVTYGSTNMSSGPDDTDVRYSLSSVPREEANIEAEGGETVLTDLNNDGSFGLYDIKGPRHSSGGVPMFLPEQSFIYSDTNDLKFNKSELEDFDISSRKKMTPASISRKYQLNKYYGLLNDEYADDIQAKTAELMLDKNKMSLSKLAFTQEMKKDFEEGVPLASHPYLQSIGEDPIAFTSQVEQISMQQAQDQTIMGMPPDQQAQLMAIQQMLEQQQGMAPEGMENPAAQEMQAPVMDTAQDGTEFTANNQGANQCGPGEVYDFMQQKCVPSGGIDQSGAGYDNLTTDPGQLTANLINADANNLNVNNDPSATFNQVANMGNNILDRDSEDPNAPVDPAAPEVTLDKGDFEDKAGRLYNRIAGSNQLKQFTDLSTGAIEMFDSFNKRMNKQTNLLTDKQQNARLMAHNQFGTNFDKMGKEGFTDVNTGLDKRIIAPDANAPSGFNNYMKFGQDGMEILDEAAYGIEIPKAQDGNGEDSGMNQSYVFTDPGSGKTITLTRQQIIDAFPTLKDETAFQFYLTNNNMTPANSDDAPEGGEKEEKVITVDDDGKKLKVTEVTIYDKNRQELKKIYKDSNTGEIIEGALVKEGKLNRPKFQSRVDTKGGGTYYGEYDLSEEGKQEDFEQRFPWVKDLKGYDYSKGNAAWVGEFQKEYEKRMYESLKERGLEKDYVPYFKTKSKASFIKKNPWAKDIDFGGMKNKSGDWYDYRDGEGFDSKLGAHTYSAPLYKAEDPLNLPEPCPACPEGYERQPTADDKCNCELKAVTKLDVPDIVDNYVPPRADWWSQDVIKAKAIADRERKMLLPYQPPVRRTSYDVVLEDPTRAIAAINEQLNINSQAAGAFGGPQSLQARTANLQGQAALNIANEVARVNQRNVSTINQGLAQQAQMDQMANMEEDRRNVKMYDDTQKVLQTYMDEKNFDREQYADAIANAITNRANTYNLNSIQDYYNIDPESGGMIKLTNTKALQPVAQPGEYDFINNYAEVAKRYKAATGADPTNEIMQGLLNQQAQRNAGIQPKQTNLQAAVANNPFGLGYQGGGKKGKELKRWASPFYVGKTGM